MKIVHLVLRPRYSGAEALVRDLAHLQVATDDVAVISLDPCEPDFQAVLDGLAAVGVHVAVPKQKLGRLGRLGWLLRAFRQFGPDVIFAHSQIPAYYAGLLAKVLRLRLVKVIHSADGERFGAVDRWTLPKGAGVIGVNQTQLQQYLDGAVGHGLRGYFVPNGINLQAFQEATVTKGQVPRVVQVGRVCEMKGQLDSLRALAATGFQGEFLMAGILENPEYVAKVQELCAQVNFDAQLLGGRKDIPELLASADLVLMPSNREAHPIAYLEALASGKPLVAHDLEVFRKQGEFNGVHFVNREDVQAFAASIAAALSGASVHVRDLSGFDIRTTSERYLEIAREVNA